MSTTTLSFHDTLLWATPTVRSCLSRHPEVAHPYAGRVFVTKQREEIASVPLERVIGIVVHGNVDVSSALLREILWRGYSIVWCTGSGRVIGSARSSSSPNGLARVRQHVASGTGRLDLAGEFIRSKIANQATQLRRNARTDVSVIVAQMRTIARKCVDAAH